MERTIGLILRWAGRACILLGVFVLVASLFLPDAVQPLNPVVCPANTELSNGRWLPANAPADAKLELVCTSSTYTESAAKKVLGVVVGLIAVGGLAIWFSSVVTRTRVAGPRAPSGY